MSRRQDVQCETCGICNFTGKRYRCLICYKFDQCSACKESKNQTSLDQAKNPIPVLEGGNRHRSEHPMQCLLTEDYFNLFYAHEKLVYRRAIVFTCPFCGELGFTESSLVEHCSKVHSDNKSLVCCPICITDDFREMTIPTRSLVQHLPSLHNIDENTTASEEPII